MPSFLVNFIILLPSLLVNWFEIYFYCYEKYQRVTTRQQQDNTDLKAFRGLKKVIFLHSAIIQLISFYVTTYIVHIL